MDSPGVSVRKGTTCPVLAEYTQAEAKGTNQGGEGLTDRGWSIRPLDV